MAEKNVQKHFDRQRKRPFADMKADEPREREPMPDQPTDAGKGRPARVCPNCKQALTAEGHFAPPSCGEPGFYICTLMTDHADLVQRLREEYRNHAFRLLREAADALEAEARRRCETCRYRVRELNCDDVCSRLGEICCASVGNGCRAWAGKEGR